jgi:hypothetical protein
VFLDGVGLLGPGFDAWEEGRQQLAGLVPTRAQKTVLPVPAALPAAERRRAGAIVKLTLAVGLQAVQAAGLDPARLPSVFASSGGDGQNCHEMCTALASPEKPISPTRFHNSVHNAASGYWGIATGSMAGSSVLCAFDGSFAAGLLEAVTLAVAEQTPVLLLVYDTDYPEPLRSARPVPDSFGVALVLSPHRTARSLVCIRLQGRCLPHGRPGRSTGRSRAGVAAPRRSGRARPAAAARAGGAAFRPRRAGLPGRLATRARFEPLRLTRCRRHRPNCSMATSPGAFRIRG